MTNPTDPAADGAETPTTAPRYVRGRRQRPMRYNPTSAEALQQAATIGNDGADESASDDAGGDLGLSAEEWAAAGEAMAKQAAQGDDGATDDGSDDEPIAFADAFKPGPVDGPEPADRDNRYRARLRDSESEVERLRGTIESLQRAEVARLASAKLGDPADLFRDGAGLADMCGDDGTVDPAKVDNAVNGVLAAHPYWRAPLAPYRGPLRSGATSVTVDQPSKTFVDAFRPQPNDSEMA